jgi:hypothetical protein
VAVAIVHSRGLSGVSAPRVSVEVHLAGGLPGVHKPGTSAPPIVDTHRRVLDSWLSFAPFTKALAMETVGRFFQDPAFWWVALLVTIPVGIATNLLTAPVARLLSKVSVTAYSRWQDSRAAREELILFISQNEIALTVSYIRAYGCMVSAFVFEATAIAVISLARVGVAPHSLLPGSVSAALAFLMGIGGILTFLATRQILLASSAFRRCLRGLRE